MNHKNTRRGFTQSYYPKGFTLIELLVVVLIIGILAAVAVPQYQKAVEKARAVEILTIVDTLKKAIDIYVLEHGMQEVVFIGKHPGISQQAELDIDVPVACDENGECFDENNNTYFARCEERVCPIVSYRIVNSDNNYGFNLARFADGTWEKECMYEGKQGEQICNSFSSLGWEPIER